MTRLALVTGGTAGIGRHIAIGLRAAGLDVIVTGRDATRGEAVARELGATFVRADHATVAGNVALGGELATRTLDVLVNNVGGAAFAERTMTAEGDEATLALNYVGPIALTHALLPALAPDARVVQVLSSALFMHRGDPFGEPASYSALAAYAQAKQLNLLASLSLARALADTDVRVNAVNPGGAWTPGVQAMTRGTVPAWRYVWPLMRAIQRAGSPVRAARVPLRLALSPVGTGEYYESNGRVRALPARLTDTGTQDRAWEAATSDGRFPRTQA